MFWNKFRLTSKDKSKDLSIFLLKVEISFKTVAQVSYKDENGNAKIVRFYDKFWLREVISFSNNPKDLDFKFFAHSPNLKRDESIKMSIESGNSVLISQEFAINKENDFTGWCQFDY